MTSKLATLRLEPAVHKRTVLVGRVTRHPRFHFLDLLIDNVSLRKSAHAQDLVTPLSPFWVPDYVASAIETLMGRRPEADLSEGRILLLVCGECADLACGGVTAALDVGASQVTWSDFRWENGREEADPIDTLPEPVSFDRAEYEAEIADAGRRVAGLS